MYTLIVFPTVSRTCNSKYATLDGMMLRFNPQELAEHCDKTRLVNGELLSSAAAAQDISAYDADARSAVLSALEVLCQACMDADGEIARELSGITVMPETSPDDMERAGCDIARYNLYPDGRLPKDGAVLMRYQQALAALRAVKKYAAQLSETKEKRKSHAAFIEPAGKFRQWR